MLGAWPAELSGTQIPVPEKLHAFSKRVEGAMVKSMREAKLRSSWASPNTAYEDAVLDFVRDALDVSRPNAFLTMFLPFQQKIARLGVRNSLVQTTLKLTSPGMPDTYQGAELWDLGLVDPDNRRPVDYRTRTRLLGQILTSLEGNRHTAMLDMLDKWRDGRIKLAVIATMLAYRRDRPKLFAQGGYEPLAASGGRANQICATERTPSWLWQLGFLPAAKASGTGMEPRLNGRRPETTFLGATFSLRVSLSVRAKPSMYAQCCPTCQWQCSCRTTVSVGNFTATGSSQKFNSRR